MKNFSAALIVLSIVITSIGTADYIRRILKNETQPNLVSWLAWTIAPLVGGHIALSEGASCYEVARIFAAGCLSLLVLLTVSTSYAKIPQFSNSDLGCGLLIGCSLFLWIVQELPYRATVLALSADTLAIIPTIIHAWATPEKESLSPYIAGLLSSLMALAAQEKFEVLIVIFPCYFVVLNVVIIATILLARMRQLRFYQPLSKHMEG